MALLPTLPLFPTFVQLEPLVLFPTTVLGFGLAVAALAAPPAARLSSKTEFAAVLLQPILPLPVLFQVIFAAPA